MRYGSHNPRYRNTQGVCRYCSGSSGALCVHCSTDDAQNAYDAFMRSAQKCTHCKALVIGRDLEAHERRCYATPQPMTPPTERNA